MRSTVRQWAAATLLLDHGRIWFEIKTAPARCSALAPHEGEPVKDPTGNCGEHHVGSCCACQWNVYAAMRSWSRRLTKSHRCKADRDRPEDDRGNGKHQVDIERPKY